MCIHDGTLSLLSSQNTGIECPTISVSLLLKIFQGLGHSVVVNDSPEQTRSP